MSPRIDRRRQVKALALRWVLVAIPNRAKLIEVMAILDLWNLLPRRHREVGMGPVLALRRKANFGQILFKKNRLCWFSLPLLVRVDCGDVGALEPHFRENRSMRTGFFDHGNGDLYAPRDHVADQKLQIAAFEWDEWKI
jgi:hypothetical protein